MVSINDPCVIVMSLTGREAYFITKKISDELNKIPYFTCKFWALHVNVLRRKIDQECFIELSHQKLCVGYFWGADFKSV